MTDVVGGVNWQVDIARLEQANAVMRSVNRVLVSGDVATLLALGLSQDHIEELTEKGGFRSSSIAQNTRMINYLRKRGLIMLIDQKPLGIASGILARTTIESVLCSKSYHAQGWQILDRWAFNSPGRLRALEAQGELMLLGRLLEQQIIEHEALTSPSGLERRRQGLAEHELLALHGITTEL
ncbi:hypothetical protein ACIGCH_11605 [Pseudomonas helleri]|uniref:hypothetical protein n=1 Tax=Pseudomonas helleri TaxID=1608996 RepID=UPI0037C99323